MSYQVIARKWRPQDFSQLVGQEHISQTLLNALRNERIHHALLFTGPRGTGKTSSARILAKALRCPNAKDFVPCNVCPECEEIASGRSLNVIEIDGASNNGVDAIRELRDTVAFQPSSGRYKLYIVDEVHMLSTSAFNALLKTLEEPPSHVIFVLATTEVQKIPDTVLSRCQRFDFRCISTRQIAAHLEVVCQNEGVQFERDGLWLIARQGAGSMRDSQSLLDQAITFTGGALTRERVVEVLGLTDRQLIIGALAALTERNSGKIVSLVSELYTSGQDTKIFAQELLEEIRNLLMAKITCETESSRIGGPNPLLDLADTDIARLRELSAGLSEQDIHLLFDMALKTLTDIMRSHDPKLTLEMGLLRMASAPRVMQIQDWLSLTSSRVVGQPTTKEPSNEPPSHRTVPTGAVDPLNSRSGLPEATSSNPAQNSPPMPTSTANGQNASQSWVELVSKINGVNPIIGAQLENCFLVRAEGKQLTLGVPPKMKFVFEKINDAGFKRKILNYVTTFWGPGYSIEVLAQEPQTTVGQVTPKIHQDNNRRLQAEELRTQIEQHPLVQSAQSVFKTQIRSIKEIKS